MLNVHLFLYFIANLENEAIFHISNLVTSRKLINFHFIYFIQHNGVKHLR